MAEHITLLWIDMLRLLLAFVLPVLLLSACSSSPANEDYEQENFIQNQTYSRSFDISYQVACDAGRRALLSQGYTIDKWTDDTVTSHKNFIDSDGNNTEITFNVNCAPDSTGLNNSQVFANAIQDRFSLKKSSTAASLGISLLGSLSLPFMSSDDALVKTSSVTVTRPLFYSGFFHLLHQYLAFTRLEQSLVPYRQPAAVRSSVSTITAKGSLTPEETGVPKPATSVQAGKHEAQ